MIAGYTLKQFIIGLASMSAIGLACLPALADNCDAFVAAMIKMDHTPHRIVSVISGEGPSGKTADKHYEEIFTGTMLYSTTGAGWKSNPKTGDEMEKDFISHREKSTAGCEQAGSETVAGESTDIIRTHANVPMMQGGLSIETHIWVSQTSGLPLKRLLVISTTGPGGDITVTTADTIEYDNIRPPVP